MQPKLDDVIQTAVKAAVESTAAIISSSTKVYASTSFLSSLPCSIFPCPLQTQPAYVDDKKEKELQELKDALLATNLEKAKIEGALESSAKVSGEHSGLLLLAKNANQVCFLSHCVV